MNRSNTEDREIEDLELTDKEDYSFITNLNINQSKSDIGFKTLVDGFDSLLYIIPKYQRKFIWSQEQVQNLAISLLRGLPIPPIYVYRNEDGQLEVLDGQQRMLSFFLYYKGKYLKNITNTNIELQKIMDAAKDSEEDVNFESLLEEQYRLKNVKYEFIYTDNNERKELDISYSKLTKNLKRKLDFTPISVIEIKVDSESHRQRVLYTVFQNLNSGGSQLKNQEIRNGVYQSEFYDMLHDINNNNEKWRSIYGEKHKHSRDVELLLRFAAVQHYFKLIDDKIKINNYEDSYPKLLNDFSDEAVNFKTEKVDEYRKDIERFIDRIEVGDRIPNLLLESLYLSSLYVDGKYAITQEFCDKIMKSDVYKDNTKSSSSGKKQVKARFTHVYRELLAYVKANNPKNNR